MNDDNDKWLMCFALGFAAIIIGGIILKDLFVLIRYLRGEL